MWINALDVPQKEKIKLLWLQDEKVYFKFLNYKPACDNEDFLSYWNSST